MLCSWSHALRSSLSIINAKLFSAGQEVIFKPNDTIKDCFAHYFGADASLDNMVLHVEIEGAQHYLWCMQHPSIKDVSDGGGIYISKYYFKVLFGCTVDSISLCLVRTLNPDQIKPCKRVQLTCDSEQSLIMHRLSSEISLGLLAQARLVYSPGCTLFYWHDLRKRPLNFAVNDDLDGIQLLVPDTEVVIDFARKGKRNASEDDYFLLNCRYLRTDEKTELVRLERLPEMQSCPPQYGTLDWRGWNARSRTRLPKELLQAVNSDGSLTVFGSIIFGDFVGLPPWTIDLMGLAEGFAVKVTKVPMLPISQISPARSVRIHCFDLLPVSLSDRDIIVPRWSLYRSGPHILGPDRSRGLCEIVDESEEPLFLIDKHTKIERVVRWNEPVKFGDPLYYIDVGESADNRYLGDDALVERVADTIHANKFLVLIGPEGSGRECLARTASKQRPFFHLPVTSQKHLERLPFLPLYATVFIKVTQRSTDDDDADADGASGEDQGEGLKGEGGTKKFLEALDAELRDACGISIVLALESANMLTSSVLNFERICKVPRFILGKPDSSARLALFKHLIPSLHEDQIRVLVEASQGAWLGQCVSMRGGGDPRDAIQPFAKSIKCLCAWEQLAPSLTQAKERLDEIIGWPLWYPRQLAEYFPERSIQHAGIQGAALLYGPPGCGKTALAMAAAAHFKCSALLVRGPELLNRWFGGSERALRKKFIEARSLAPCILVLDDIETIAMQRGAAGGAPDDSASLDRMVNQLLTEIDSTLGRFGDPNVHYSGSLPVFVIATTSAALNVLDPALLRPGRIEHHIAIAPPTDSQRQALLSSEGVGEDDLNAIANARGLTLAAIDSVKRRCKQKGTPLREALGQVWCLPNSHFSNFS